MRERFPGFYRPTDEEFDGLWQSALIVPDANVLLALYRLSDTTRAKLLQILDELKDRLFVPHQVAFEFQKNRIRVIDEQKQAYETVEKQVKAFARKVGGGMGRHPRLDKGELERRISEALEPVTDHLAEVRADHPDPLISDDVLGSDSIRDALSETLEGRLGEARDVDELIETGRKRYEEKQPPGYEDGEKDEPDRYGDLAIWLDMIAKAQESNRAVIFVTEERKEDWWWKRGEANLAPRRELVEEMRQKAGQQFYMYSLERFMKYAAQRLDIDLSEEERDDVARAGDASADESSVLVAPHHAHFVPNAFASGATPPQYEQNFFQVSPAQNRGFFTPTPSDPQPFFTWTEPWNVAVDVRGTEAELSISFRTDPQLMMAVRFTCAVTTPNGEAFRATVSSPSLQATLRFPTHFKADLQPEAGIYGFAWTYSVGKDGTPHQIGSGTFELEGPEVGK